jgi:hypothetical protein
VEGIGTPKTGRRKSSEHQKLAARNQVNTQKTGRQKSSEHPKYWPPAKFD